jgi:hypothetical protein
VTSSSALSLGGLVAWTGSYFWRGGSIGKSRDVVVVSWAYRHVTSAAESSPRAYVLACDYCCWLIASHIGLPPPHGGTVRSGPGPPHCRGFRTTLGRTPQGEWSAWRRDLYLTTRNTHKRQTSMSPAEFEPADPRLRPLGHWGRLKQIKFILLLKMGNTGCVCVFNKT